MKEKWNIGDNYCTVRGMEGNDVETCRPVVNWGEWGLKPYTPASQFFNFEVLLFGDNALSLLCGNLFSPFRNN